MDGHAIRSTETRARMIDAAIEVFGMVGYRGASTRAIAGRAGVNLAAIPYHFGGKRELYLAAARAIADYSRERLDPAISLLQDPRRADPVARIDEALSNFFHLVVGGPEPQAWVAFFVRSEHDADDAFRVIYDQIFTRFEHALLETLAEAVGGKVSNETLRIRVAIVLASIVNFRILRNMTLSNLGWNELNANRLERLDKAIRRLALSELLPSPTSIQRPKRRSSASQQEASQQRRRRSVRGSHRKERTNVQAKPRA